MQCTMDCPSARQRSYKDTPDVGTPVSVLEIGFKRKCAPGRKSKPSPLTADPDLPLRFREQKKRRHIFSPLDVQYVRVLI